MSKKKAVEKEDRRGEEKNLGEKCRNKKTYVFNLSTVSGQKYVQALFLHKSAEFIFAGKLAIIRFVLFAFSEKRRNGC